MATVKIKINEQEVEVPASATVLEAALKAGIDVPYMCYHPGMKVVAVCRVCQVEVKGMPKLQTACSTPVKDGMEVFTETPAAKKARQGTVEFWLVNHPLDCPICDKGGECPLQDVTYNVRGGGSRLRDPKVNRVKRKPLGEHIVFDAERCILCWRCTRFTQDISGSEQLQLVNRGIRTEIDTPPGVTLTDPFSGNLADVCPVGSLTTREFRFKSRPWEMTAVESTCTACPVGCSNTLWSKVGVVQRMTARENLHVNDYWLCDRGRLDLGFVNDPSRLVRPKVAGSEESDGSTSWEDAARAFAATIQAGGKTGTWAVLASPHATNEEYFALQRFARGVLGSSDLVLDTGPGGPELSPARAALIRSGRTLPAVTDIDGADVIFQFGGDLEATHPVYSLRVRKAVRNHGARLHLATATSGGLDRDAASVRRLDLAKAADTLSKVASGAAPGEPVRDALVSARRGVVIVNAGSENDRLLGAIGDILKLNPALKVFLLDDGSNLTGAWDSGFAAAFLPGYTPVDGSAASRRADWGERVPASAGRSRADVVAALKNGTIQNVLLFNSGRPWVWTPELLDAALVAEARVSFDLFPGRGHDGATVAFPSPSMAEVDGTVTAPDHRVLLLRRSVPGPERLWHPAMVLARVENIVTGRARPGAPVDVFRDLARSGAGYEGMNYGLIRPEGRPWSPAWTRAAAPAGGS